MGCCLPSYGCRDDTNGYCAAENGSRSQQASRAAEPRNDVASRSYHTWPTDMNHLLNDIVHVAKSQKQIHPMLKLVMYPLIF
jgi:hypothetical protein